MYIEFLHPPVAAAKYMLLIFHLGAFNDLLIRVVAMVKTDQVSDAFRLVVIRVCFGAINYGAVRKFCNFASVLVRPTFFHDDRFVLAIVIEDGSLKWKRDRHGGMDGLS